MALKNFQNNSTEFNFAISLMEHLVVPTFVLDTHGNVIIWNKAVERLTGLYAHEVIGTKEHWRAFYSEPKACLADLVVHGKLDHMESNYVVHEYSQSNSTAFGVHAECWNSMPQLGRDLYLSADAGPIYDNEGNLMAVVETLRDMTSEKHAASELERLAMRDGLTALSNRRHFEQTLKAEWGRLAREGKPFSLIMIDVDHFKLYNDRYGHVAGDECLRSVAEVLGHSVFRSCDVVARYGGEEFAIILPDTPPEGAEIVALRALRKVSALNMKHEDNEGQLVSVSLGIATVIPSMDLNPEQLVWMADEALYKAKNAGRNRFITHNLHLSAVEK